MTLSHFDHVLTRCMAKYFVLGITSLSSSLLVFRALLLQFFEQFLHLFGDKSNIILFHVIQLLVMLDVVTNILCIYCQFQFAKGTYFKMFSFCHNKIFNKVENKALGKLRNDNFSFYSKSIMGSSPTCTISTIEIQMPSPIPRNGNENNDFQET
eukprot:53378_1